jgi:thiamine transport system ATP-binding protein
VAWRCRRGGEVRATVAVDGVSLQVAPGETVALLGASARASRRCCGRSGGTRTAAPRQRQLGRPGPHGRAVHRRGFVMMFQDGQLFPHLSVAGNVGYALNHLPDRRPRGAGQRAARVGRPRRVRPRPVTALSGGQPRGGPRPVAGAATAPADAGRAAVLPGPRAARAPGRRPRRHPAGDRDAGALRHPRPGRAFAIADRIAVLSHGRCCNSAPPPSSGGTGRREVAAFLGYGPFLSPAQARALGWHGEADAGRVASPGRLVWRSARHPRPCHLGAAGRGRYEVTVELPGGVAAECAPPIPGRSSPSVSIRRAPLSSDEATLTPEPRL